MRLFTIGHSTRTLDEFVDALRAHRIDLLVDVRAFPGSKRHPHFSRESLERVLPEAGIGYEWFGHELGGYRKKGRPASPHTAIRSQGFRNYADHMESASFGAALDRLLRIAAGRRAALMCAEHHPSRCHRSFVADHLVGVRAVEVVHLLDARASEPHRLRPEARVDGSRLVYDGGEDRQATFF